MIRAELLSRLLAAIDHVPDPEQEGFCGCCSSQLELIKVKRKTIHDESYTAYVWKHWPGCWYGDLMEALKNFDEQPRTIEVIADEAAALGQEAWDLVRPTPAEVQEVQADLESSPELLVEDMMGDKLLVAQGVLAQREYFVLEKNDEDPGPIRGLMPGSNLPIK